MAGDLLFGATFPKQMSPTVGRGHSRNKRKRGISIKTDIVFRLISLQVPRGAPEYLHRRKRLYGTGNGYPEPFHYAFLREADFFTVFFAGFSVSAGVETSSGTFLAICRISPSRSTMAVRAGRYREMVEAPFSSTCTG